VEGFELEQEVTGLLQTRRYDPEILPRLEAYVAQQVALNKYDSDANMAVMKLYQFYPERYHQRTVVHILAKSLMALPATDFLCAMYMIALPRQTEHPLPLLSELVRLLETGMFHEFWARAAEVKTLRSEVTGFDGEVRNFMISVIARTFSRIELTDLAKMLNLEGGANAAKDFVCGPEESSYGWRIDPESSSCVLIPPTEFNSAAGTSAPTNRERLSFRSIVASRSLFNST